MALLVRMVGIVILFNYLTNSLECHHNCSKFTEDNFNEIFAQKLTENLTITTTLVTDASPLTSYIIIVT